MRARHIRKPIETSATLRVFMLMMASLMAAPVFAQSHALFDALDLQREGLEEVARAVDAGDITAAERLLLDYYQRRTSPDYAPPPIRRDVELAEQNVRNIFTLRSATRDFGAVVDWHWEQEDKEWQYALNRMDWLRNFAGVYLETGDERYVQARSEERRVGKEGRSRGLAW